VSRDRPAPPVSHPPQKAEGPVARPVVRVAVGVVLRGDGAVLLADRPGARAYTGYWEFPGGKIEPGESIEQALARELAEELAITIIESVPWVVYDFDYPHAYVRLYFRRVFGWHGTPRSNEGQRLLFHQPGAPAPHPLLPAALPVMRWLQLPDRLSWTAGELPPASPQPQGLTIGTLRWRASAVSSRGELALAVAAGADFAVAPLTGEKELAALSEATPIPLYAPDPGGADALKRMRRLGLHGLLTAQAVG
jgi:8-oxo-dGTP diphosphatase